MKIKAAVLHQFGRPLQVEEVDLEEPREKEVLVKMVATGVCHTDLETAYGNLPAPLPIVLGHEGSGIVEKVGEGITDLKPGDQVVLTGGAACGRCRQCLTGQPVLCEVFRPLRFGGTLPKGERRHSKNGKSLNHYFLQSSFAEYAVVPENAAVRIRNDAPLEKIGFLGCGVITGLGAVFNYGVKINSSVAVFGCGTLGLSAVMAARLVGVGKIIAVDTLAYKLKLAGELGASDMVNATEENATECVNQLTSGGADYNIVAVGNAEVMTRIISAAPPGSTVIILGAPPKGACFSVEATSLLRGKRIIGSSLGSGRPSLDIPNYVNLFMAGKLPLDKLVSTTYPLNEINDALKALEEGEAIKAVINF